MLVYSNRGFVIDQRSAGIGGLNGYVHGLNHGKTAALILTFIITVARTFYPQLVCFRHEALNQQPTESQLDQADTTNFTNTALLAVF